MALAVAARARRLNGPVLSLIIVTFAVGVGSFLFHTFTTMWAALADTGPIMVFILGYFVIAMRCFGGFGWGRSLVLMLSFVAGMIAVAAGLRPLNDVLHGSQGYIPAFLALLGTGLWLRARAHPAGPWLLAVAGIFAISLVLRSLDRPLCEGFALGTHWLWHLLNSLVLGTLIVALIRHGGRRAAQ